MQPIRDLDQWLLQVANVAPKRSLFTSHDLRPLFPDLSDGAFRALLSRAVRTTLLSRVCRNIYLHKRFAELDGKLLYYVAALLRTNEFQYISLETVLSDAGVISQVPMGSIFIMSSGRSNTISCGEFGTIEFIHTNKRPLDIVEHLTYDSEYGMYYASVALALRDMKATRRNYDLIDWDVVDELT